MKGAQTISKAQKNYASQIYWLTLTGFAIKLKYLRLKTVAWIDLRKRTFGFNLATRSVRLQLPQCA